MAVKPTGQKNKNHWRPWRHFCPSKNHLARAITGQAEILCRKQGLDSHLWMQASVLVEVAFNVLAAAFQTEVVDNPKVEVNFWDLNQLQGCPQFHVDSENDIASVRALAIHCCCSQ